MTSTAPLRVGPVVRDDWESRDMAGTAEFENGPNPYCYFTSLADAHLPHRLNEAELREVIADADWQADPYGPGEGDPARRAAYRRLLKNARKALAEIDKPVDRSE